MGLPVRLDGFEVGLAFAFTNGMTTTNEMIPHKNIVVLTSSPGALIEIQRFMGRRQCNIRVHSNVRDFLTDVVVLRPEYAFISTDYSHESLGRIRRMVDQVYRVKIVEFSEDLSMESAQRLDQSKHELKLTGRMTGPAIERFLVNQSKSKSQPAQYQSRMKERMDAVIGNIFKIGKGEVHQPLTWTNRVTCVQVTTSHLSGHFLIAMGMDRTVETELLPLLEITVREAVHDLYGERPQTELFQLNIRRVEFKKWAAKAATFMERSVHHGVEVAMAFFPDNESQDFFEPSEDSEMISIDLSLLKVDSKVGFDIYLHLPLSKKYLLYVPRGGRLSETQYATLENRSIQRLHVPKTDLPALQKDCFSNRCDRMISDYYENRLAS